MSTATSTATESAEIVEWLCAEGKRRSGTDVERRLALGLAERLRSPRRRSVIEPVYVHPQWQLVHFAHCAIAIAGSLLAGLEPAAGFALVLAAATSFYLDVSGRAYLLRRIFFRRASQNVVSAPIDGGERPRVVITAGYDAGLTGAAYNEWATRGFERLQRLLPGAPSPASVIFWSMALLLPALGLRMAGIEETWVAVLQLPQTLALMVAAFMLGEIGLSPVTPGAAHNGSGVAAALAAAKALDAEPPRELAVSVVLATAGEAGCEGLRAFLGRHRDDLDRDRTWFIDLSSAGSGSPRFVAAQTPVLGQALDPELLEFCDALAEGGGEARRLDHGPASGAAMAAGRGHAAIALTARENSEFFPARCHQPGDLPETLDPATIEAVTSFAVGLVRLLDRQLRRESTAETRPRRAVGGG